MFSGRAILYSLARKWPPSLLLLACYADALRTRAANCSTRKRLTGKHGTGICHGPGNGSRQRVRLPGWRSGSGHVLFGGGMGKMMFQSEYDQRRKEGWALETVTPGIENRRADSPRVTA